MGKIFGNLEWSHFHVLEFLFRVQVEDPLDSYFFYLALFLPASLSHRFESPVLFPLQSAVQYIYFIFQIQCRRCEKQHSAARLLHANLLPKFDPTENSNFSDMYLLWLLEHGLLDFYFSHSARLDRLLLFSVQVTHLKMHLSILILIPMPFIPELEGSDSLWKGI